MTGSEPTPSAPPQLSPTSGAETAPPAGTTLPAEPPPLGQPFEFHGEAREFFRIWIVNILLTLLTLGVFAAWAKVRKRRYVRGNTTLMGHAFDYRADPRRILLGHLFIVVVFLAYAVVGEVYVIVRLFALGALVVLLPWVVLRSLAFNARQTAYRGLCFNFRQTYGLTALTYLAQGLAVVCTMGLYYPAWVRNRREYTIGNHRLGSGYFTFTGRAGPFYRTYLLAALVVIGGLTLGAVLSALWVIQNDGVPSITATLPALLFYGLGLYLAKQLIYARLFNYQWGHIRLNDHRFEGRMRTRRWLSLQFTNLCAILASGGLLYPWALMRRLRYTASCLHFHPAEPLDDIVRLGRSHGSAVGETAGEFIGLDFGL
jgi:uncharacterized membrane protein YjgN (DUF898 family)